jgi:hypothetical protein
MSPGLNDRIRQNARSQERAQESRAFLLTKTYMDAGEPTRAEKRPQSKLVGGTVSESS